jgi:hypothetical protein
MLPVGRANLKPSTSPAAESVRPAPSGVSKLNRTILFPSLAARHRIFMERPAGVTAIAIVFLLVSAYLATLGLLMLVFPGTVGMRAGAPFLGGLELAGPYMFLLAAVICALTAWGLIHLNNWARRGAAILAMLGIIFLVPAVSSAVISFHFAALFWGALGVMVRVIFAWYLYQRPVIDVFEKIATN